MLLNFWKITTKSNENLTEFILPPFNQITKKHTCKIIINSNYVLHMCYNIYVSQKMKFEEKSQLFKSKFRHRIFFCQFSKKIIYAFDISNTSSTLFNIFLLLFALYDIL